MTPQKLKEKLNEQYVHDFMKEVGIWLRRYNIRNAVYAKPKNSKEINFLGFILRLTYTSYHFILKFNDTGLVMTLVDNKNKIIGHYQDLDKLKKAIVEYIKQDTLKKRKPEEKKEEKSQESEFTFDV